MYKLSIFCLQFFLFIFFSHSQLLLTDFVKNETNINQIDQNGLKQGKWYLCLNGSDIVYSCVFYKNDTLNGEYSNYFIINGKTSETGSYRNGLKHGKENAYYKNGNFRLISNYKEGKLNGITESYNQLGELKTRLYYIDNLVDTTYANEFYHPNFVADAFENKFDTIFNVILNTTTIYKNDIKHYSYSNAKGRIIFETFYKKNENYKRISYRAKGRKNRIWKIFVFENNRLSVSELYKRNGKLKKRIEH